VTVTALLCPGDPANWTFPYCLKGSSTGWHGITASMPLDPLFHLSARSGLKRRKTRPPQQGVRSARHGDRPATLREEAE